MFDKQHVRPFVWFFSLIFASFLFIPQLSAVGVGYFNKETVVVPDSHSTGGQNVELVGQIGGATLTVAIQGDFAYVGEGAALTVLDVSNKTEPVVLGRTQAVSLVQSVAVTTDYAYVATYDGGLRIVNISNPAEPIETGVCDTHLGINDVAVVGEYAYVTAPWKGLQIIDVSDPENPTEVGFFATPGNASGLAVDGHYAYVADGPIGGIRIIDVSNPETPTEVGFYDTPGHAENVAIAGNMAYVVEGESHFLRIIDVTDRTAPSEIGSYHIDAGPNDVDITGDTAFLTSGHGLHIINVADPASPIELSTYELQGNSNGVAAEVDFAYVVDGTYGGIHIISVEDLASADEVGLYDSAQYLSRVSVAGNFAHVIERVAVENNPDGANQVRIINVTDPLSPSTSGFYGHSWSPPNLIVLDNYAYTTGSYGLRIFDVSDPAAPSDIGTYAGAYGGLAVVGDYVYTTGGDFRIIDISDPSSPNEIGSCCSLSHGYNVAVSGDYAYVADYYSLKIIDVSDPTEPNFVGAFNQLPYHYNLVVVGNYAYVVGGIEYSSDIKIIDVSDPTAPYLLGRISTPYSDIYGITFVADLVYVAGHRGLYIVDITNPSAPSEVGFYDTSGSGYDVTVVEDLIYFADAYGGLLILRLTITPIKADFSASPKTGVPPLEVDFTNLSTGSFDQCLWDFGDNSTTESCDDPSHTYSESGTYTVSLAVQGPGGNVTMTKTDFINVYGPPTANFNASPDYGAPPLTVNFSNLSKGDCDRCEWDFGDGRTKVSCGNPVVKFNEKGEYTISLTVSGPGGEDTKTMEKYIKVFDPLKADFSAAPTSGGANLYVSFTNLSSGDFDRCVWDFGDGRTKSSCANPNVIFKTPGKYTISLTVSGYGTSNTKTANEYIEVIGPPTADFSVSPPAGTAPLWATFTNLSAGQFDRCVWDFGDGRTKSSCGNPTVKFKEEGEFTISLKVTGVGGEDIKTAKNYIKVFSDYRAYLPNISGKPKK